jgi:hypothetical protein
MRIAATPLACLACRHEWTGETVQDAPAEVWTAAVRVLRCPACGARWHAIAFRTPREDEAA